MFMGCSRVLVKLSGKLNREVCHYLDHFVSNISKWSQVFINVAIVAVCK